MWCNTALKVKIMENALCVNLGHTGMSLMVRCSVNVAHPAHSKMVQMSSNTKKKTFSKTSIYHTRKRTGITCFAEKWN